MKDKLPEGVLVDDEDLERVLAIGRPWYISTGGYVKADTRRTRAKIGKQTYLHRLIMDAQQNEVVDHINRDPKDNRKSNLRIGNHSENCLNRGAQSNSKSGHKGISWDEADRRWKVYATKDGKRTYLGGYKTLEEAIEGYNLKIESVHGEWAVKN